MCHASIKWGIINQKNVLCKLTLKRANNNSNIHAHIACIFNMHIHKDLCIPKAESHLICINSSQLKDFYINDNLKSMK